jgi:hypothetical protein
MKRLALVLALLLVPIAVQAFDPEKPETIRIGVLKAVEPGTHSYGIPVEALPAHLRDELRRAGFDAFTIDRSLDELASDTDRDADFYVEIQADHHYADVHGGVDIAGRYAGARVEVGRRTIEANIRVYDAATLELFTEFHVDRTSRRLGPTAVGIGGRAGAIWAGVTVPLGYLAQRNLTRSIAKTAAVKVADAIRIQ